MYCTLLLENKLSKSQSMGKNKGRIEKREKEKCTVYYFLSFSAADLDLDESQEASRRQGPLPDLLPQTEHPSWASPHHRAPRGEAVQELEVRRVASQLRAIGDQLNATIFRRAVREGHSSLHNVIFTQ
uniref:Uncharacterized protein n=1 Tax=Scophthalmus maximus TaxID=52904 RepID=A0A8D3BCR1_SCOMX